MTKAQALKARTAGMSGWNHTPEENAAITHKHRNQYRVTLFFDDGSVAWMATGSAQVNVKGSN